MVIVNTVGIGLIILIAWWFWFYKSQAKGITKFKEGITVTVENGTYLPSRIELPASQAVSVEFLRKDESPCAATLLFPTLDISEELVVGKSKTVHLPALAKGEYPFHCQMQMYRGMLVVE